MAGGRVSYLPEGMRVPLLGFLSNAFSFTTLEGWCYILAGLAFEASY